MAVGARPPRVLYVSGSIGMGHVSKDLAIAREVRRVRPDVEIVWLAGHPASQVLRGAGERLAPQAEGWIGASAIAERCTRGGQLNLVRYVYRSLPSWAVNTRLIMGAVDSCAIDVVVGNEAWEVDIPLVMHVLPLRTPFVMIFDFVGCDAMTDSLVDRVGAYGLNALWSLDAFVYHGRRHSALFIGEPEDVPDAPLGWGLPNRRAHARAHYEFVGHAIGFQPEDYADRGAWRRKLGYGDEPLVVCAVGGTSIGRDLLELCAAAWPYVRERLPGARLQLVCGPRLAPRGLRVTDGAQALGFVPRLYEHFACCDVAVVQCGASATTELAALRRPFIHFPVEGHFEQERVAARLRRYGLGRRLALKSTTPAALAAAILEEYERADAGAGGDAGAGASAGAVLPTDGARRAAKHILRALERTPRLTGAGRAKSARVGLGWGAALR